MYSDVSSYVVMLSQKDQVDYFGLWTYLFFFSEYVTASAYIDIYIDGAVQTYET